MKEKRSSDKEAADKEIAALTAAAEDRERDPRVKRLVKQTEDLFEASRTAAHGGGGSGPPPEQLLALLQDILKVEPDFTQVGNHN